MGGSWRHDRRRAIAEIGPQRDERMPPLQARFAQLGDNPGL